MKVVLMSEVKPAGANQGMTPVHPVAPTGGVHPRLPSPATVIQLSPIGDALAHEAMGVKAPGQIFTNQDQKKLIGLIKRILKDDPGP